MSPGGRRRTPPLTLVASSGAAGTQAARTGDARVAGERDWSQLMARAQDGDRAAYRTLLEDITPYLRALATRCFRDTGDIEDAVQDVLLTVHAVRHAYDPGRPFAGRHCQPAHYRPAAAPDAGALPRNRIHGRT
jgi:RNA polymerase sigma-70 factor (ECF subfamily)